MKESWEERLCIPVYVLVCIALVEGILLTGGRLFSIGPLSFRMILFAVIGIFCIPYLCKRFFPIIKNPYTISLFLFAAILAVGLVRAIQLGQEMSFAVYVLKGCMYLLWFPILLVAVHTRRQAEFLLKIIIVCGSIVSLGAITVIMIAKFRNE